MEKEQLPFKRFTDGLHEPTRTISLGFEASREEESGGALNSVSVMRFLENLHALEGVNHQTINVNMSCIGGDVYLGLAIYDAIRHCKSHIHLTVYGPCFSMGVAILQAADRRIMMPYSTLMIHAGNHSIPDGHPKDVEAEAEEGKRLDRVYNEILSERSGTSVKEIDEMCTFARYIDAKEAVTLNLADEVSGRGRKKKWKAKKR